MINITANEFKELADNIGCEMAYELYEEEIKFIKINHLMELLSLASNKDIRQFLIDYYVEWLKVLRETVQPEDLWK